MKIVWRRDELGAKEFQVQKADPRALTQGPCDETTSVTTEIGFRCDGATAASFGDAFALRRGSVSKTLQRSSNKGTAVNRNRGFTLRCWI